MVTTARITGVIKEGYLIEVVDMFSTLRYCQPMFAFPTVGIPYQDWVDTYKDKFLAVITFQDDGDPEDMQRALMMGMVPLVDNQTPAEGLEGHIMMLAKHFRIWMNDVDKELVLDNLNAGKIKFGNKNVTEPLMLGDKTKSWLEDICDKAKDTCTYAAAITVPTPAGTSGPPVNAAQFTQLATDFAALKTQISTLLSTKVFTE
jgi:hypothetical protein